MTKTIFISITEGLLARNILRSGVFDFFKNNSQYRVVLLMPRNVDEHIRREVAADNVVIEDCVGWVSAGAFRHIVLYPFMKFLIFTDTTKIFKKYGTHRWPKRSYVGYFFMMLFYPFLSKSTWIKRLSRRIDQYFSKNDKPIDDLFAKYNPDLVFVTNIFLHRFEHAMVRVARRHNVLSIGMVKSWDNINKFFMTVLPDVFLVWNKVMKKDLIDLQAMDPRFIFVTGVPQYDIYLQHTGMLSREAYCKKQGLDPDKKIILFASPFVHSHEDELIDILYEFVEKNELDEDCSILVRPHFHNLNNTEKTTWYDGYRNRPHMAVDQKDRVCTCFSEAWDPSVEDMVHYANTLHHADVVVTFYSTLSLDAAVFDKPIINLAFDGHEDRPEITSFKRGYKTSHYKAVVRTGGVWVVENKDEFKHALNTYLQKPDTHQAERQVFRDNFCDRLDGKSAERVSTIIDFFAQYRR